MSYKTNRLANLFPDVYAARETESLLYKLLDAIGAELMAADESVKELLKSHWVNYASGTALDGLAAIYGIARRSLPGGVPEPDELLRQRLKSLVSQFTGGGTREAIKGAVPVRAGPALRPGPTRRPRTTTRGARQPDRDPRVLRPSVEWLLADSPVPVHDPQAGDVNELAAVIEVPGVGDALPEIQWTFNKGAGRRLSLQRLGSGQGIKSTDDLLVPPNATLSLAAFDTGELDARLAGQNVTTFFTNLDGSAPAILPAVPGQRSQWRFRAESGVFDVSVDVGGFSASDTFDLPDFSITLRWERRQPLTFDVFVPYFLSDVVQGLAARYHYTGTLFVYEGLPLDVIQEVVDQTRAAGVRGNLHLALNFYEDQAPAENPLTMNGLYRFLKTQRRRTRLPRVASSEWPRLKTPWNASRSAVSTLRDLRQRLRLSMSRR